MPKDEQIPVIYEPWKEAALDLYTKFAEFHFESGRITRYVESKPFIFPDMPEEDLELYKPVTNMHKVAGGYTFTSPRTLLLYLSNPVLSGFANAGKEEGENVLIA